MSNIKHVYLRACYAGNPTDFCDDVKYALMDTFNEFASNADHSMSEDNLRRYMIACGCGESSFTTDRMQRLFENCGAYSDRWILSSFF